MTGPPNKCPGHLIRGDTGAPIASMDRYYNTSKCAPTQPELRAIARALGGDVSGDHQVLAPGPGHSARDRSLSVRLSADAPDGFVVHSFAGDDPIACRDYVRDRLGMPAFQPRACRPRHQTASPRRRRDGFPRHSPGRDRAVTLWNRSINPVGTPVLTYLASRGLALDADMLAADAIRYHAECPFHRARRPAMVALVRDVATNAPLGVHRTALRADGTGKAGLPGGDRRMLGPCGGGVVKLDADVDVTTGLHISEGIETAIAAAMAGFRPAWASISAGNLANFPVLAGLEALSIIADNDAGGVGQRAAETTAERYACAGIDARIVLPDAIGADFADLIEGGTND